METATLGLLLTRLGRLNEQFLTEVHRRHNTTSAEAAVLLLLANTPDKATNPSVIAERIVQTTGGLTATLKRLAERGWVERLPDPEDGRGLLVSLTGAGRLTHDAVFADLVRCYQEVFVEVDTGVALTAVRELLCGFERVIGVPSSAEWTHEQELLSGVAR